jgi:hypothetical protein
MQANWKDLETRGFLVIRGFLSEPELEMARADFQVQRTTANANYKVSMASADANAQLLVRVNDVLAMVSSHTDLRPNVPGGGAYFATGRGVTFSWHQDHYLNFYIPIIKQDRMKSNLCVVPFDVLQRESPETYRRLYRSGASRFIRFGSKRLVFCDDSGAVHVMPKDIETMAETPALDAGDLLLMRGDVVHRTQDADTERVALSFRVASNAGRLTRSALADGGLYKARMMANNAGFYERVFKAFDMADKEEMTLSEMYQILSTIQPGTPKGPKEFMKLLMAEKRRSHVYARFWPKVVVGAMAGRMVSLYERYGSRTH